MSIFSSICRRHGLCLGVIISSLVGMQDYCNGAIRARTCVHLLVCVNLLLMSLYMCACDVCVCVGTSVHVFVSFKMFTSEPLYTTGSVRIPWQCVCEQLCHFNIMTNYCSKMDDIL